MFPKNTTKILLYLLKNFDLININQLSKSLNVSVGSVFKILKNLEQNNFVQTIRLGNAVYYSINLNNSELFKICELLLLEEKRNLKKYSKIYSEEIIKFNKSKIIILFGSILKTDNFKDVDVLFVTNNFKEVSKFCLEVAKVKSKPVVPLILNEKDFINQIKNKKEIILEIIKSGIILRGENEFLEVIKNAKS